ncbi:IS3 family transposase [Gordonia aurantiaca]|uniref:IS3 family transposase n=1 Tax=Gordonia sp. B21 TaxID=3151852 RepID=UPI000D621BC0|nr:hypothetical protein ACN93_11550 [Gordonia paraffinivorans]
MAETFNSLFKAECIRNPDMRPAGDSKKVGDVEMAVAEYVDCFNHRRLHGDIGLAPAAGNEPNHRASQTEERTVRTRSSPQSDQPGLHDTRGDSPAL